MVNPELPDFLESRVTAVFLVFLDSLVNLDNRRHLHPLI